MRMIGQIDAQMCRWIEEDRERREGNREGGSSQCIFKKSSHILFSNIVGYISALGYHRTLFDFILLWSASFDSSSGIQLWCCLLVE